jgi:hypothetical protein
MLGILFCDPTVEDSINPMPDPMRGAENGRMERAGDEYGLTENAWFY